MQLCPYNNNEIHFNYSFLLWKVWRYKKHVVTRSIHRRTYNTMAEWKRTKWQSMVEKILRNVIHWTTWTSLNKAELRYCKKVGGCYTTCGFSHDIILTNIVKKTPRLPSGLGGVRPVHLLVFFVCGFWLCLSSCCILCTYCCQCLWNVHSWLPFGFR
jgi:hypothetical protein